MSKPIKSIASRFTVRSLIIERICHPLYDMRRKPAVKTDHCHAAIQANQVQEDAAYSSDALHRKRSALPLSGILRPARTAHLQAAYPAVALQVVAPAAACPVGVAWQPSLPL